jgi:hypothetical protein
VRIDPNTIQANQGDTVKPKTPPAQEQKQDAPKEETKKDDSSKDSGKNDSKEAASNEASRSERKSDGSGVIYVAPGEATKSGKEYVGRTSNPAGPVGRGNADGRDRSKAKVVDTYTNTREGKTKEQQHMDKRGGVEKLDNKRNEIDPKKRKEYGLD